MCHHFLAAFLPLIHLLEAILHPHLQDLLVVMALLRHLLRLRHLASILPYQYRSVELLPPLLPEELRLMIFLFRLAEVH